MRFASLSGSGNGANYAAAGKAVANSAANIFNIQRKTGPDYGGLSQVAMKTAADVKVAGIKAAEKVTAQGLSVVGDVASKKIQIDGLTKSADIKRNSRKAGALGAIGSVIGAGYLAAKDNTKGRERPKGDLKDMYETWKTKHDGLKDKHQSERDSLGEYKPGEFKPTDFSTGGSSGKVTGGSDGSSNLGGQSFDLSKLTDADYNELGYVISSEAQLGTDDEFGVAANVLTRLQSGKYGNSIGEIIRAKGQYEGVYTGNSTYSPEIVARLKSPDGQKKIQEFFTRLDGRTEFKGQTQLQNRVRSEDPMFSSGGNFYHYAGQ